MPARLSLLGSATLGVDGAEIALPVDRRGCLLAYLAVEGSWVSRDRLALLFWPDADESTAKRNLRQLVLRARRLPLTPTLEVTPDALRWPVECDVAEFRRSLAAGDVEGALASYGGELLTGFDVHDVGGFDAWLEGERDRLNVAYQDAGLKHAAELLATGRYDDAARRLEPLHAADRLAEDVLVAYVRALYLAGKRETALTAFARFEAELRDELGLEPLHATLELVRKVRQGEPLEVARADRPAAKRMAVAPTHLAGRDAARHALLAAETQVVLVCGEPGIGKSALLAEALPGALSCRATEGLERLPYHPFVSLLRSRPHLVEALGPYREDIARLVPDAVPDVAPAPVDADVGKTRVAEAIARIVEGSGGAIVIDDLQWADPASLEVVVYLARRDVRVYGSYRSGEVGPGLAHVLKALRGARLVTEVVVEPLDERAVQTLIADLMRRQEGPPAFSRRLWRHTGGNPMFVLETLRTLFESGRLRSDESGWHTDVDDITVDYSELAVPAAIEGVIARRLEHLRDETARVLEALAIARGPLKPSTLTVVTGLSATAVAEALDEAELGGFYVGDAFRHDLLRQVIDSRVSTARRRLLHGHIAEALEGDADLAVLAEHWFGAGETGRARDAWLAKATELRSLGLQPAAMEMLTGALERLPDGEDSAWLRLGLADTYLEANLLDRGRDEIEAVRAAAATSPALRLKASMTTAWLEFQSGHLHTATEALTEVRRLARTQPLPDAMRLDIDMLDASIAYVERRRDDARALLEPAVRQLRARPPSALLIRFMTSLAAVYDDDGRHEEAQEIHREGLALAKALGSGYYQVECALNLVYCLIELGRLDEAVEVGEAALDLGYYSGVPLLRNNLAAALLDAGRVSEAFAHFEQLVGMEETPFMSVIALAGSADCLGQMGRLAEARAYIDDGLDTVTSIEMAIAIGSISRVTLTWGTPRQVERLATLTRGFDPLALPDYAVERIRKASAENPAAAAMDDAWWAPLAADQEEVTPA